MDACLGSLVLIAAIVAASGSDASDHPQATLSNGLVDLQLYLPDAERGFYRGTRFDWAGTVARLEANAHTYFAPWFVKFDPDLGDIEFDPALNGYAAGPASADIGPVEEFRTPIGYREAAVGGTFLKVGVGMLRKPEEEEYSFFNRYEIVNGGTWNVRQEADRVEFVHDLTDESGYGYVYVKTLRLPEGKPELILEHRLENTGRKPIETSVYNHNFIVLDGQPTGPDFVIKVPFEVAAARDQGGFAETRGKKVVYLRELQGDQWTMVEVAGFGDTAADYDIKVENAKAGAGLRITGDRPLTRMMVWAIRPVRSPEPYIDLHVEPGSEFTWRIAYEFYDLP
ncbi:MAG: hypothetical protein LJF15_04030 [Acidobacteria bacterium]|jgi:hypothetical protein|nr:hypothetical protein [Acidobacteriota bacterium]